MERKNTRQWKILIGTGVLLIVLAILSFIDQNKIGSAKIPEIGKPIANLSLTSLDGIEVNISDFHGKVILINSWATWCPPCKAEMPSLEKFYRENRAQGFEILAINAGEPKELISNFKINNLITFPIFVDPDGSKLESFGITNLPTSIVVNQKGIVEYIHIGMLFDEDLEGIILPILQD